MSWGRSLGSLGAVVCGVGADVVAAAAPVVVETGELVDVVGDIVVTDEPLVSDAVVLPATSPEPVQATRSSGSNNRKALAGGNGRLGSWGRYRSCLIGPGRLSPSIPIPTTRVRFLLKNGLDIVPTMNPEPDIEEAIHALGRGDHVGARIAVSGMNPENRSHGAVIDAIHHAATELENDEEITDGTWNGLADALIGFDLDGLVDSVRS